MSGPQQKKTERFLGTMINEKLHSYRRIVVDSFIEEHAAFARYAAGEPSRVATAFDGMRTLEIVEAALAARARGSPVR